jgi:hypothetical protein
MARGTHHTRPTAKPEAEAVPAADVSFTVWKAEAVLALAIHQRAAAVTRDSFWTRLYVRGFSPEQAAEMTARDYDATHRPERVKARQR